MALALIWALGKAGDDLHLPHPTIPPLRDYGWNSSRRPLLSSVSVSANEGENAMRKLALAALVLLLLSSQTSAGPGGCTIAGQLNPMGFEQITVSNSSIGFTATLAYPTGGITADMAQITLATNAATYRDDGIAPTATVGYPIAVNTPYMVCGLQAIKQARFIRVSADGTLNVLYYRQ